jgi:hypothetical protein
LCGQPNRRIADLKGPELIAWSSSRHISTFVACYVCPPGSHADAGGARHRAIRDMSSAKGESREKKDHPFTEIIKGMCKIAPNMAKKDYYMAFRRALDRR